MQRRRRPEKGAAGSGPSGIDPMARPGSLVSSPSGIDPMARPGSLVSSPPSSSVVASAGSGSTGEMKQKMADAPSSGVAPMVHPEKRAARTEGIMEAWDEDWDMGAATAWCAGVPTVHPGKGAASTVSSGEMLDKKASTVTSAGVPVVDPGKLAAGSAPGSGSSGDMLQKKARARAMLQEKAAAASSRGAPRAHTGKKGVTAEGPSRTMLQKEAAGTSSGVAPPTHQSKGATSSGSIGGRKKAAAFSSGAAPLTHRSKGATSSGSIGGRKKAAASSIGGVSTAHHDKVVTSSVRSGGLLQNKVATTSSEEMLQKNNMALNGKSSALGALDRNTTSQDCDESAAKHSSKKAHTLLSAKIPQKHCTDDKAADMGLSERMLQKQSSKVEVDTGLSEEMLHGHPAKKSDTANDIQDSDSHRIVHIKDASIQGAELLIQEAELLMQQLNDLGKGEDISNDQFFAYYKQLSSGPDWINLKISMEHEELDKQQNRHALYRLRYYKHKFSQQASKEELLGGKVNEDHHLNLLHESDDDCKEEFLEEDDDLYNDDDDCDQEFVEEEDDYDKLKEQHHLSLLHKSENDCDAEFLEEEGYFRRFENEKTFDWFFNRDYLNCSSVNDYQCLVLKNYAGTEYTRWSEYHEYLHSYEIELEYVKYCEELSKQLKWMEDYMDTDRPSVKWSKISSRGAYQAIKIAATSFHKITPSLAYNGYFECKESMVYDFTFYKELDGVYFEIWRRITDGTKSFKEALEEVYNLNMFRSRQRIMKAALESDFTMKRMEEEFRTCTEAIKPGVEDKALELINEAVRNRVNEPKSYEQYIRKKIEIARIIGLLDSDED